MTMRSKKSLFLLAALLGTLLVGSIASMAAPLRLATLAPKDTSFDKTLRKMGQVWKKETSGKASLIVYAGGSQGSESELINKMRVNRLHAALLTGIGLSDIDDGVAVFQKVPLLYRNFDELEHVMGKLTPVLEKRILDQGFVVLTWIDSGWVRIFSKSPLLTPDDMRQSKLFTWSGDTQQTDLLKKMGFRPIPIESTEIVSSLTTGLVDTVPMPPFYALASQSYSSAPYMLDFNYAPIIGAIVISKRMWDRFSEEEQAAMKAAAEDAGREMTLSGRKESEESISVMAENFGLKSNELDDNLREQWESVSKEAYGHIRDNTVPGEIWDQAIEILEEYRSGAK